MKISWSIKYKKNSNNAKDVAFQDIVVLSNKVKFLEVSESVRGTNENILKYKIKRKKLDS